MCIRDRFTAKTDMEEVYSILSEKNLPHKILMQQPGSSQDKVLNEFKEDTNSVRLPRDWPAPP